jgi:hypothetical protein
LAGALLVALTAVACNDGPAPPAEQPDAGPPDACTSNAVLVTAHQAEIGLDAWEWARNNPYLAPDGRGGVLVGWPEDRDGDGQNECYGQYVAPDGTLAAPTNGVALGSGAELLCSAMYTSMLTYLGQSADGDQVFAVLQEDETVWNGPWRLSFQKLHHDLTARSGPTGAFAMACEPDPSAEHGV